LAAFVEIVVGLLVGSVSGLVIWLSGRKIAAPAADGSPAERFHDHRMRVIRVIAVALAVQLVLPAWLPFSEERVPLPALAQWPITLLASLIVLVAIAAGNFPARRALRGESWGFSEYLFDALRTGLALGGFWALIVAAPYLVHAAGRARWWVALSLCTVLMLWLRYHGKLAAFLLRARAVTDGRLLAHFGEILSRSQVNARPEILRVGSHRGGWVNALALPALPTSRILLTQRLLDLLEPAESAAIFAHEVAHLETFTPPRLRRAAFLQGLLVLAATALTPTLASCGADAATISLWLWLWVPCLLIAALRWARKQQTHETAGDLRAVELCGSAEALARSLSKLHAANLVPRRLAAAAERASTHPSLARRLQRIRASARSGEPLTEGVASRGTRAFPPLVLRSERPGEALVLDESHVHWIHGCAEPSTTSAPAAAGPNPHLLRASAESTRSVAYANLVELRLCVKRGRAEVRAVDTDGRISSFPVAPPDVAAVQQHLDLVDSQLAPVSRGARRPGIEARVAPLLAGLAPVILAQERLDSPGSTLCILLVALIASALRSRAWIAALSGMVLVHTLREAAQDPAVLSWAPHQWLGFLAMTGSGLWCLHLVRASSAPATAWAGGSRTGSPGTSAFALLLVALVFLVPQLLSPPDGFFLLHLHMIARDAPGAFLPLVGAGAALACSAGRMSRIVSGILLLAGASQLGFASDGFAVRFGGDPLVSDAPRMHLRRAVLTVKSETTVPGQLWHLRLSPGGTRFWGFTSEDSFGSPQVGAVVADFAGAQRTMRVEALDFVDDDHLLAVHWAEEQPELRRVPVDDPARVSWRLPLNVPGNAAALDLRVREGRWSLIYETYGVTVSLTGTVGNEQVVQHSWQHAMEGAAQRFASHAERALEVGWLLPGMSETSRPSSRFLGALQRSHVATRLRVLTPKGPREIGLSSLRVSCFNPEPGDTTVLCLAGNRRRDRIWAVSLDTGIWSPLAVAPPTWNRAWDGTRLGALEGTDLLVLDPRTQTGTRAHLDDTWQWSRELALRDSAVAFSRPTEDGRGTRVRVAQVDPVD